MKKILVLLMVTCMVFLFTINVVAEPKVYLDYLLSGTDDVKKSDKDYTDGVLQNTYEDARVKADLSGIILGFEMPIYRFKIGIENGINLTIKDNNNSIDLSIVDIKSGYRVVDNETLKLDATLASVNTRTTYKSQETGKIEGILLGVDGIYHFTDRVSIEGSFGYSVNTTGSFPQIDETISGFSITPNKSAKFSRYKLKFNYLFTDYVGVALGYMVINSSIKYDLSSSLLPGYVKTIKSQDDLSSFTLGFFYKY